jgi:hypothetical protein
MTLGLDVSLESDFPALRACFRKLPDATGNKALFEAHQQNLAKIARKSATTVTNAINEIPVGYTVLWGCGNDLLELLDALPAETHAKLAEGHLVDRNVKKQGQVVAGMRVIAPSAVDPDAVRLVVAATRSSVIRAAIEKDAACTFPRADRLFPYMV